MQTCPKLMVNHCLADCCLGSVHHQAFVMGGHTCNSTATHKLHKQDRLALLTTLHAFGYIYICTYIVAFTASCKSWDSKIEINTNDRLTLSNKGSENKLFNKLSQLKTNIY